MAKYGLPGSCAQYLAALNGSENGLTVSKLSEVCMKDKAAVSRAIAQLEMKELVSRNADGTSTYRAPIVLTKKGKDVSDYVAKRACVAVEIAGLGESEREGLYTALDLIAANLTKMCEGGLPE